MEASGYPRGFSTGFAVSSCILSLLIPPSIGMIIYGLAAHVSIPLLFAATLVPGIILTVILCIISMILCRRIPTIKVTSRVSFSQQRKNIVRTTRRAFFTLFLPVVVLGGLYSGIFTTTESAAVAVVYALIVGWFIYGHLNPRRIWEAVVSAGMMTGAIIMIVFFFLVLSHVLIKEQVPSALMGLLTRVSDNRIVLLILINIILFVTGMFMDDISGLILSAIVYLPMAQSIGVDPVHFGAICAVNLGMGLLTPPVAPILYLGQVVSGGLPLKDYIRPVMYCIVFAYLPVIILTTYVPQISLALPHLIIAMRR
jgi:tripartite ATP-independent transporter DctM subunit